MNRRDAVKTAALLMGSALSASTLSAVLNSCNSAPEKEKGLSFTTDEKEMIKRMADVILPRTDTPGAVDAGVPEFIIMMMRDCYPEKEQDRFHGGLSACNKWCKDRYGKTFLKLSSDEQETAVADLDKVVLGENGEEHQSLSFYRTLKELTLLGFFTSEPGTTQTLRYVQIPGKYEGCVPYHEGDKAWAT